MFIPILNMVYIQNQYVLNTCVCSVCIKDMSWLTESIHYDNEHPSQL